MKLDKSPLPMANSDESLINTAKRAAGKAAANFVLSGMIVGLGSGTTSACFIKALGERCRSEGLKITTVASSEKSKSLAISEGIPCADIEFIDAIDLYVDGADEIDNKKNMIKGGGGALLREKILANAAREFLVIVDNSKCVDFLGRFPLPVEITPFGSKLTAQKLKALGYQGSWRMHKDKLYVTDNGNYIFDITLNAPSKHPKEEHQKIRSIPGIIETGFFLNMPVKVIVGYPDGRAEILQ